ncbi:DUF6968 family protein [Nocardia sp. NPDC055321]
MGVQVGEIIARRTVADGDSTVLIEMGMPADDVGGAGVSGFRIEGLGEYTVTGVDAIGALYNALLEVGAVLSRANTAGHDFTVLDSSTTEFPAAPSRRPAPDRTPESHGGEVVAFRILINDGEPLAVEIARPTRALDQPYFVCRFRIDGRREAVASGFDEIQALLTAVRMIGAWLRLPADWPVSRAS